MALGKLNRLGLLSGLYGTIHIPRSVYREVVSVGLAQGRPDALSVRLFVELYQWPILEASPGALRKFDPSVVLDEGETELLVLAQGLPDCLVLMDDEAGRSEARRMGLQPKGNPWCRGTGLPPGADTAGGSRGADRRARCPFRYLDQREALPAGA